MTLFAVQGVSHGYRQGPIFGHRRFVPVLENAALHIGAGECVALVGATGSGKSTLGRILLGVERPRTGTVLFNGRPLLDRQGRMDPATRRSIQAVFQDPMGATSPRFTAGEVVAEALRLPAAALRPRVAQLLARVGLDPELMDRPAHRLSGGQLQRLCIARALAPEPRLVLLDEAVSSLDVEIQAEILALLRDIRLRMGTAYLFVTHDLRLLRGFADRCYVMDGHRPVEVPDPFGANYTSAALAMLTEAILPEQPRKRSPPSERPGLGCATTDEAARV